MSTKTRIFIQDSEGQRFIGSRAKAWIERNVSRIGLNYPNIQEKIKALRAAGLVSRALVTKEPRRAGAKKSYYKQVVRVYLGQPNALRYTPPTRNQRRQPRLTDYLWAGVPQAPATTAQPETTAQNQTLPVQAGNSNQLRDFYGLNTTAVRYTNATVPGPPEPFDRTPFDEDLT